VAASGAIPPGTVLVDKTQYEGLVAATKESSDFITKQREKEREGVVAAAIADGRISPASKGDWLELLKVDRNGEATLASLKPGLIPVELRAHGDVAASGEGGDGITAELVGDWSSALFPEVRAQREHDAMVAAGNAMSRRSRVQADASYRR
jgi:hypothetical protein